MNKLILSFITFISFFSLSFGFETNIKVGYDFFRESTLLSEKSSGIFEKYKRGFVIGIEVLPLTFNDKKIKLGAGFEYNFGETSVIYVNEPRHLPATMTPLYVTMKFTYYRLKNIDLNLYTFGRLGYAFAQEDRAPYDIYGDTSGIYYGLGFGIGYKYFLAEILYDGKYKNTVEIQSESFPTTLILYTNRINKKIHDFHHKIGVRLGLQLSSQHFKKPQIINYTRYEHKKVEINNLKTVTKRIVLKGSKIF